MNSLLISNTDGKNKIRKAKIKKFVLKVLKSRKTDNWEISLLFCTDHEIAEFNLNYRKKEGPTDVLSFSQDGFLEKNSEQMYYAGDIVISIDTVRRNSEEFNVSLDEELKRVIIHGILHLEGFTHNSNKIDEPMIAEQEKLLGSFQGEKLF